MEEPEDIIELRERLNIVRADLAALLERAVATGEKARLALDANNFACLRQDYLGLRLPTKKNAQGESRLRRDGREAGNLSGWDCEGP